MRHSTVFSGLIAINIFGAMTVVGILSVLARVNVAIFFKFSASEFPIPHHTKNKQCVVKTRKYFGVSDVRRCAFVVQKVT